MADDQDVDVLARLQRLTDELHSAQESAKNVVKEVTEAKTTALRAKKAVARKTRRRKSKRTKPAKR